METLGDTRVVTLNGARQVGKSTLAGIATKAYPNAVVRLLDDPATLQAARDDPAGFVEHDGLMVIDEVQLAPELFRSITAPRTSSRSTRFSKPPTDASSQSRSRPERPSAAKIWPGYATSPTTWTGDSSRATSSYTGQQTLPFGDRIRALPIDALWNTTA